MIIKIVIVDDILIGCCIIINASFEFMTVAMVSLDDNDGGVVELNSSALLLPSCWEHLMTFEYLTPAICNNRDIGMLILAHSFGV